MPDIKTPSLAGIQDMAVLNALRTMQESLNMLAKPAATDDLDDIRADIKGLRILIDQLPKPQTSTASFPTSPTFSSARINGPLVIAVSGAPGGVQDVAAWIIENYFALEAAIVAIRARLDAASIP